MTFKGRFSHEIIMFLLDALLKCSRITLEYILSDLLVTSGKGIEVQFHDFFENYFENSMCSYRVICTAQK